MRRNLDEIRGRISPVTLFPGNCDTGSGSVQLTTKFPVEESLSAFNNRSIDANRIDIVTMVRFASLTIRVHVTTASIFRISTWPASLLRTTSIR